MFQRSWSSLGHGQDVPRLERRQPRHLCRDTAGDAFRGRPLKGSWFWKLRHVKWLFLASLLVYLLVYLFLVPGLPQVSHHQEIHPPFLGGQYGHLLRQFADYPLDWQ